MDTLHSVNNNLSVKVILLMTVNVRFPVHLAQSLPRFCHLTLGQTSVHMRFYHLLFPHLFFV